jgi:hypothetical protein
MAPCPCASKRLASSVHSAITLLTRDRFRDLGSGSHHQNALAQESCECLTLDKWEIVSGRFGGYLRDRDTPRHSDPTCAFGGLMSYYSPQRGPDWIGAQTPRR